VTTSTNRKRTALSALAISVALLAGCGPTALPTSTPATPTPTAATGPATATAPAKPQAKDGLPVIAYSPSSPPPVWPGPLPYPIIIADRANDRILEVTPTKRVVWEFPGPQGLAKGSQFGDDDDVFFTPGGRTVITNEEHQGTIAEVDYYSRQIVWTYGHYGVEKYGNGYLDYPDDAYRLPNGTTIVADIRNCRELFISPSKQIIQQWGLEQAGGDGACPRTSPPTYLGSPNGDTPQPNGNILLSIIGNNSVAMMSPQGKLLWQAPVPDLGNGYVSDAQLLPDGDVLTVSYGKPGRVVIFNPKTGQVDWLYDVTAGPGELDHPSLALPLPNGNILLNDDYNDRVVVIDRQTKQIVWQYGVKGVAGTAPGYINTPDGLDIDWYRNWQAWLQAYPTFGVDASTPGPNPGAKMPNPEASDTGGA
jgi:outer membrane protein assembly factor BamB